eukprot:1939147-Rhodomonas_salina.1
MALVMRSSESKRLITRRIRNTRSTRNTLIPGTPLSISDRIEIETTNASNIDHMSDRNGQNQCPN